MQPKPRKPGRASSPRTSLLPAPKRVQKLQMALHAKAKAEAGYRFYALYDKVSRDDILAHPRMTSTSTGGSVIHTSRR